VAVSDGEDAFLLCGGGIRGCGGLFHVDTGVLCGKGSRGGRWDWSGMGCFKTFATTGILRR